MGLKINTVRSILHDCSFLNCVEMCLSQQWRKGRPDNFAIGKNNKNSHNSSFSDRVLVRNSPKKQLLISVLGSKYCPFIHFYAHGKENLSGLFLIESKKCETTHTVFLAHQLIARTLQ